MCPKPNDTGSLLSKKSHVEDIPDAIPALFQALTVEPDPQLRWTTFTFPVDHDLTLYSPKPEMEMKYTILRKFLLNLSFLLFSESKMIAKIIEKV